MTIMIVEDNPAMRREIRSIAAGKRDTVVECSNGQEAVDRFITVHPELVLMDISMPVLDGIQATRAIHELDPRVRIVMVSENDSDSFRRVAREAGASGFVAKSDLFELESVIRDLNV